MDAIQSDFNPSSPDNVPQCLCFAYVTFTQHNWLIRGEKGLVNYDEDTLCQSDIC